MVETFCMRVKDGVTRKWGKYEPHYYYNKLKHTPNLISQKKDDCNQRQKKEWPVGI